MKLEWYRKTWTRENASGKGAIPMWGTSCYGSFCNSNNTLQLTLSYDPIRTDTINTPARPEAPSRQDATWADDILGLGVNNPLAYQRSLAGRGWHILPWLASRHQLSQFLAGKLTWFIIVSSIWHHWQKNQLHYPNYFCSRNGCSSHPRVCCTLWESFLFRQRDNYGATQSYQPRAHGGFTDA